MLGCCQYEAFSFQEDGFLDKNSNKEWAKLSQKTLPELERLTVCVWVKLHFRRIHNQVWSYCALKRYILVCSGLNKYILFYFFFSYICKTIHIGRFCSRKWHVSWEGKSTSYIIILQDVVKISTTKYHFFLLWSKIV